MAKIGRNEPCPCGSGQRYKRCHGSPVTEEATKAILRDRIEATEFQRRRQQGHGRPIQSFTQSDGNVVVVGKRLFKSPGKTFHEFLLSYVAVVMGQDWFAKQMASKSPHPAAQWALALNEERRNATGMSRKACNGTRSLLALAYNLYLVEHHYKQYKLPLLERLLSRLRRTDDFFPTMAETYAAASFLKAGFDLEYENDRDAGEHAEFVATFPTTGRQFSVEVKTRAGADRASEGTALRLKVTKRLERALSKKLAHQRVVWIDLNIPDASPVDGSGWISEIISEVDAAESDLKIAGEPAPPAYLFISNQPYHYNPQSLLGAPIILALGFKINDFQSRKPLSFKDVVMSRRAHVEMHALLESMKIHTEPPITFDGQAPEFAFATQTHPRLLVGNNYLVPTGDGTETIGTLESATMMESQRLMYGVYRCIDGVSRISTTPASDAEIAAWKRHPETFFGKVLPVGGEIRDPLELAEFMYATYKDTPKSTLLTFFAGHPMMEDLELKSQDELAIMYCDMTAASIVQQTTAGKK